MYFLFTYLIALIDYVALSEKLARKPVNKQRCFYTRGKCYICEQDFKGKVMTSCGHYYCGIF